MIKNYTTKVDVYTSIGEIQAALARSGASKIMIEYDTGKAVAISFCINTATGLRGFTLPAPAEGTLRVFKKQGIKCDPEQASALHGAMSGIGYLRKWHWWRAVTRRWTKCSCRT